MFLYRTNTEHNFELSHITPDTDFDVVWVNPDNIFFEEDGSLNYEDNSDLFLPWPSFTFQGITFHTDQCSFFKGKDNIEYCFCFWPSDYTLEFFVNITTLKEGGTVGCLDSYDEDHASLEYAASVNELIELISHQQPPNNF